MSQRILSNLDALVTETFQFHCDGEGTFTSLKAKVSHLATQIAVLEKLGPVARLVRRGEALPMRALSYNIKKLSEDDSKRDGQGDSRWASLQKLGCQTAIFSMISCSGLALLAAEEYDWLLNNVRRYLTVQELPRDWVAREQIRKVLANAPRRPNIISFLNSYHDIETRCITTERNLTEEEPARKRIPVENSRLWKWERSQEMDTTGCLATLFPKDETQDVSFTIWCGHNDGYFLNDVFAVQRAISS
ncbi:hypothetical protein I7I51_03685 [Histoplasma capsulatum]|uniref:Uncharacterized protein n=1 Tax=Ajellomyces capsulatus TaxID=5037 RepID=A0A8A1M8C3_AJECA|nr:hypothetical protein I7I51_03685 [Histoplasma capsulatum]